MKHAEKAAQYQAVLAAAREGIIGVDTNNRITIFNKAASDLLQVQPIQAIGSIVYGILPEANLSRKRSAARATGRGS